MQPRGRWSSAGGRQEGAGCAGSRCGDPALQAAPHGGCSIAVPPRSTSGHRGPVPGAGGGLSPRRPQPRPAPPPGRAEPSGAAPSRAQAAGSGHHAPTVSSGHGMGVPGGGSRGGAVGNPWVSASSAGVPRGGCRCSGSLSCCSPPLPRSPVTCAGGAPGRLGGSWEPTPWGALPVGDGEGNGALRQLSCPAFPTGHQPVTVNFSSPVGQLPLLLLQPVSGACGGWREADKGSP